MSVSKSFWFEIVTIKDFLTSVNITFLRRQALNRGPQGLGENPPTKWSDLREIGNPSHDTIKKYEQKILLRVL